MQPLESKDNSRISELKPKVLVVDDEQSVLKAMEIALANEGYDLYFSDDGKKGLEVFHKEAPQLIFLDLKMPIMNGYEFLKALQPSTDSPFTLVVITGHGETRHIERCYEMGIDFYLRKPLSLIEVCGLAKRCIYMKKLEKERLSMLSSLQDSKDELELLVSERTDALKQKTFRLEESNIALRVLLKQREVDKKEIEAKVLHNVEKLILPSLENLKTKMPEFEENIFIEIIESNLKEITSSFAYDLSGNLTKLTPTEIQVANMVRNGIRTKQIAKNLRLSQKTIATHRQNIRKKLSLTNKKMNLQTFLSIHCSN